MRLGWPPETCRAFLAEQFRLQTLHYSAHYPGAMWAIAEAGGQPAGKLGLAHAPTQGDLRVIDSALMPPHRGQGLGGALMGTVQQQAVALGAGRVSLHVEQTSRAVAFYRRLGFVIMEERGPDYFMVWPAPA